MPWRKKGSFYDTTRDFWQIQQMMDEEDERRENWNRDHADFCDDLDEFGEDTNEDLGFESDFDDDTLLGLDDDSCTWRKEHSDDFSEYNLYPEDYATEEEFLEALEDVKTEWRENYHDAFLEYSVDPENFETEEEFLEVLEEAKTAWRREYSDAFLEYHVDPKEFKTEDEFLEVLEEAKTAWREQYSEAKTEYNLDPEDYETEDEFQSELEHRVEWMERWKAKAEKYNLCLPYYETEEEFVVDYMLYWREELQEKADDYGMNIEDYETDDDFLKAYEMLKAERIAMGAESPSGVPELDAIDPKKYRDMDTYRAAYRLKEAEIFSDCTLSDHEKYIYQLMVERPFPQGKYLDDIFGFRYNEAIADNLNLPVGIDKEDLADERSITDLIAYIDRVDEEFSFTAWKWCVDTFWPYCKYNDYLVYGVLYELNSLTESFRTSLINEICSNQVLRSSIFTIDTDYNREITDIAPKLFYELLKAGKIDVAIERYRCLRQNKQISEKDQFTIIENLINACCNYDELETLDLFMETIMPLTEDLPPEKLAWRKKSGKRRLRIILITWKHAVIDMPIAEEICGEINIKMRLYISRWIWRIITQNRLLSTILRCERRMKNANNVLQ